MKDFLQISSNQLTVYNPIDKCFVLKSEIVISAIEPEYQLARDENKNTVIAKIPKSETFRFIADTKELISIRDRINEELEMQENLAKEHSLDPKY
jgi:hypothetical protein